MHIFDGSFLDLRINAFCVQRTMERQLSRISPRASAESDWACCDVVFQTVLNALVSAGVLKTRAVGGDLGACAGM